jgi:hypothetical protein
LAATTDATDQLSSLTVSGAPGCRFSGGGTAVRSGASNAMT